MKNNLRCTTNASNDKCQDYFPFANGSEPKGAIQDPRDVTPTAGLLLGSGERMEGYVRRGIFYLEKSGSVPARVDVVQRWRP
eukprot:scaffold330062_cov35-Attheya_sp.AAC.1